MMPNVHKSWRAFRRAYSIPEAASPDMVSCQISEWVTHKPGFIYTNDEDQPPNPEIGLPGHQMESVRSLHGAILEGLSPLGDCDDFVATGCELMYRAGLDARRILKMIVCDENQFRYENFSEDKLRVSHIVAGYYLGALPDSLNVADALARDEVLFQNVRWLCDTWDQSRPPEKRCPWVMRKTGEYNRHLPVSVSALGSGIAQYAVKGSEQILVRAGMLRSDGSIVAARRKFSAKAHAADENAVIIT